MEAQKHIREKGPSYSKQVFVQERDQEQEKEASPKLVLSTLAPPNSPQSFKQSVSKLHVQHEGIAGSDALQMQSISDAERPNIIRSIVNPIYEEIRDRHKVAFKEVNPDECKELYTIPVEQRIIYVLQEPLDLLYDRQKQIAEDIAKQKAEAMLVAEKAAAEAVAKGLNTTTLEEARKLLAKRSMRSLTFQEKVMIASFIVVAVLLLITMLILYFYGYLR